MGQRCADRQVGVFFYLGSPVNNDLTGSPSDEPRTVIRKDGSWSGVAGSLTGSVYTGIDPRCE